MKYLVQVSYTNPAHEHVSLRRRVDTVNRIVEAANEEQAILRVSRQQRALGFMVKEANVVKPKAINEDVKEEHPPEVVAFASHAHEQWRKGFDPEGEGKERIKKNSDGSEGNINVPFHKLHPDWQKENLAAGHAAREAIKRHPDDLEKASEHVHNEWMKRNPKADYNAAQHVPYNDLPEHEKQKDRDHVIKMKELTSVNESSISYNKPKPKNTDGWSTPKPKPRHTDGWSTPKPKDAGSLPDYVKRGQQEFDRQTKAQNKKPVQAGTLAAVHKSMEREMERSMKKEEVEEMHETSMIGGKKLDPKSLVWKQTGMNHSDAVSRHGKENVKIAGKNRFGEPIVHVKVPLGEEVEYIEEKLTLDDPVSKWISDFVHSDNPRFEGKSRKKRIEMALGAYYETKRKTKEKSEKNEAVEKKYNEKEVKSDEKKQDKKKGSMNKLNMKPDIDINLQGVK